MSEFLDQCRHILGWSHVLTEAHDTHPYLNDWRKRTQGTAIAVLRPGNSQEVAQITQLCHQHRIPIVPQGGNTGLVQGGIPDQTGTAVLLSLRRLNRVRQIDVANLTMTVEAGCTLQQLQTLADQANCFFPLSLASEGSCTIGGNLSTNAGGTAVLRYGNARDLCLGLEVVTPQGELWDGLRSLRKDNTGYDLKNLYIGAEGSLGIITAAVVKLFPKPNSRVTALVALNSASAALALLNRMQNLSGTNLCAFELISEYSLELVQQLLPELTPIFQENFPYYTLLEVASHENFDTLQTQFQEHLETCLQDELLSDVAIAMNEKQSADFWKIRESISEAQAKQGRNVKHDISLPSSIIPQFIERAQTALHQQFPSSRLVCFGHLGDGNLHFNVYPPTDSKAEEFEMIETRINRCVHDLVHRFNGSISAEHGIGVLKREELQRYASELELRLMRQIKAALDPLNLMNPGKLL
jgi:D-lactate dehydrogenase (cytochrome)